MTGLGATWADVALYGIHLVEVLLLAVIARCQVHAHVDRRRRNKHVQARRRRQP